MNRFLIGMMVLCLMALASLAQAADIRVYFSPNGGTQEAIVAEINKAHESIDIAMFAMTSRAIAKALIEAKDRKVKIRIALDPAQIKDKYSKSRYLTKKEIDVKYHLGPGLMHDKFAVIDDREVITGSYNWTETAEKKNTENLLMITDRDIAKKYKKEFKHIWSQSGEGA